MEETDRDQKKKSIIPQLPSCFMSPETPGNLLRDRLTPCFDSPSSIFPTPPCSQEKESISHFHSLALDEFPRLNFELDESDQEISMQQSLHRSPLMPEDRVIGRLIGIKSVDFISDLLAVNGNKICQRICSYLEPLELCRQDFNFFFVVFEIGRYVVHNRCQYDSFMNENHSLRSLVAALNWFNGCPAFYCRSAMLFTTSASFLTSILLYLTFISFLFVSRFASVSRTWRNVVKGDTKTSQRWKGFLRDCKDYCALKGKVISQKYIFVA